MTTDSVEFDVQVRHEIGLLLPDGKEVWPPDTWHGRGIETAEDRRIIVDALASSAENLHLTSEQLWEKYRWLWRTVKTYITVVPDQARSHPLDTNSFLIDLEAETVAAEDNPNGCSVEDEEGLD